jgi:hypothetical protein
MKALSGWGGLAGVLGGFIWALMFYWEAVSPGFDLRNVIANQPAYVILMALSIAFQSIGFYSLATASSGFSIPHASANTCAVGALVQTIALITTSILRLGGAWLLGILAELAITIALAIFSIASIPTGLPRLIKIISFLMVPVYFVGWAFDPGSYSAAPFDFVNLSATLYGLLWVPFGLEVWNTRRKQIRTERYS